MRASHSWFLHLPVRLGSLASNWKLFLFLLLKNIFVSDIPIELISPVISIAHKIIIANNGGKVVTLLYVNCSSNSK
jgi:hypothetical protein